MSPQATSISAASVQYLEARPWWPAFRQGRPANALLTDILCLGHFCRWLGEQHVAISECTHAHVLSYRTAIATFRPGPRHAFETAARDLVEFLAGTRGTVAPRLTSSD